MRCERALEHAREQLAAGDAAAAAATLRDALALWRGEPLADLADAPFARDALPALRELRVALRGGAARGRARTRPRRRRDRAAARRWWRASRCASARARS